MSVQAMAELILHRSESTDDGTFGRLTLNGRHQWATLEPPWKENRPFVSCIPTGVYTVVMHWSPRFGVCYRIDPTPERTNCLFHWGNFGGDEALGKRCDTLGCVLLGMHEGEIYGQPAVMNSKQAFAGFMRHTNGAPGWLTINDPSSCWSRQRAAVED